MKNFGYAIKKYNIVEAGNDFAPKVTVFTFLTLEFAQRFQRENRILLSSRIFPSYSLQVPTYGTEGVIYEPHEGSGVHPAGLEEYPHLDTRITRKLAGAK